MNPGLLYTEIARDLNWDFRFFLILSIMGLGLVRGTGAGFSIPAYLAGAATLFNWARFYEYLCGI